MNDEDIETQVSALADMELEALRKEWKRRYGTPPSLRSEPVMRHLLAWRIQRAVYGGLDDATKRLIARTGPVEPEGKQLGIGAVLSRNWKGRQVLVTVETNGFRWEDQLYPSLSAAATAIAGSRWNGPRFFGLRDS